MTPPSTALRMVSGPKRGELRSELREPASQGTRKFRQYVPLRTVRTFSPTAAEIESVRVSRERLSAWLWCVPLLQLVRVTSLCVPMEDQNHARVDRGQQSTPRIGWFEKLALDSYE